MFGKEFSRMFSESGVSERKQNYELFAGIFPFKTQAHISIPHKTQITHICYYMRKMMLYVKI